MTTAAAELAAGEALAAAVRDAEVVSRWRAKTVRVPGSGCLWWTGAVSGPGHGRFWLGEGRGCAGPRDFPASHLMSGQRAVTTKPPPYANSWPSTAKTPPSESTTARTPLSKATPVALGKNTARVTRSVPSPVLRSGNRRG